VTLEHGIPERLSAWFDIREENGGTTIRHIEELTFGHGPLGVVYDTLAWRWFAHAVEQEVAKIARLLRAGERGRGIAAHATGNRSPSA
jgi:hypothetical protein